MKVVLKIEFQPSTEKNHFNNLPLNCIISFYYCFISSSEQNFIAADKVLESSTAVCDLLSDYYFHFKLHLSARPCLGCSSLQRVVDQAAKRRIKFGRDRCQLGLLDLPWVIPATCNAWSVFQEGLHVFCCPVGGEWDRLHPGMPSQWPERLDSLPRLGQREETKVNSKKKKKKHTVGVFSVGRLWFTFSSTKIVADWTLNCNWMDCCEWQINIGYLLLCSLTLCFK